ncbi:Tetratricopeptide repeat-containing protein [Enterovibrio nigricans DSM 22720]|uniref:Tetratricopeptide repeat-containing protein n=2 Tax=Enterovibrio nigricans TaxID=504469 RepID=A0A1T4UMG7_9GAMM|nr:Tetratricopeptide repeat-containing protein [Enterovibrio nigricans DSM 22720]
MYDLRYSRDINSLLARDMNNFGIAIFIMGVSFSAQASDPDFSRHLSHIEQLLSKDELTEAASIAKALVADNDEQAALHQRLLGYIYLSEGNYDRAYLAYTSALKYRKLPESLRQDTLGALVSLSMKRGKPEVAIQYSRMYLSGFPPYQPVEQLYTRALFAAQNYPEALKQANAVIAGYSDIPEFIWQIKALSEEQLGQQRALINTTRELQQRFGEDIRWQRKQAAALAYLGSARKALSIMEAVPSDVLTHNDYLDLARYASRTGDPDAAIAWLNKGTEARVVVVDRAVNKTRLEYKMQAARWMDAWDIASDLNKQPEIPLLKAQCKIASQLQKWDAAAILAQQAIDLGAHSDPFLWEILGYSAMKTHQLELSRSAYLKLKQLDPEGEADIWLKTLDLIKTN